MTFRTNATILLLVLLAVVGFNFFFPFLASKGRVPIPKRERDPKHCFLNREKSPILEQRCQTVASIERKTFKSRIEAIQHFGFSEESEIWKGRSIHFRNVCFENDTKRWIFYGENSEPFFEGRFPKRLLQIRAYAWNPSEFPKVDWGILSRSSEIPKNAFWSKTPHHVLMVPSWPENIGHALFDDIFSVYRLLRKFNAFDCDKGRDKVKIWLKGGCAVGQFSTQEQKERGCRFLNFFGTILSSNKLEDPSQGELGKNFLTCVKNLYVGTAADGQGFNHIDAVLETRPGVLWKDFVSEIVHTYSLNNHEPKEQLNLFLEKNEKGVVNPRNVVNMEEIVTKTREAFGRNAKVMSVDLSLLSLQNQLELIRSATVLLSICGATSMLSAVQPPSTTRILFDYWDPIKNQIGKMEYHVWKHDSDVMTLYYPLTRNDIVFPPNWKPPNARYENEYWKYRDFGSVNIVFEKLKPLIEMALQRWSFFDVKANSNHPLFHLIWNGSDELLDWKTRRSIGSIFKIHPNAHVILYSNNISEKKRNDLESLYRNCGFEFSVKSFDIKELAKDTPIETSSIDRDDESLLLRLLLLYLNGGIHVDVDFVFVERADTLPSTTLGWKVDGQILSDSFIKVDEKKSEFSESCLREYPRNKNKKDLLTKVLNNDERLKRSITILPVQAFHLIPDYEASKRLYTFTDFAKWDLKWIEEGISIQGQEFKSIIAISLFNSRDDTREWDLKRIDKGSLAYRLLFGYCDSCVIEKD